MIDESIRERYSELPRKDIWINEASFGFEHVKAHLNQLSLGSNVLEVGSGSGLLLTQIRASYPHLALEGIEPIGKGFDSLAIYHEKLQQTGIRIHRCGYEDFEINQRYDFIYLVNVFEHLPNWVDFLSFVQNSLSSSGVCLIMCPNYGFPYESHFRLPVIINKKITHYVFKKKIAGDELEGNCAGLWDSLNFVKLSQLRRQCKLNGMDVQFDKTVIAKMIDRLEADKEFSKRQGVFNYVAKLVKFSGLLALLQLRPFYNFSPYMKVELRLKPN